MAPKVNGIALGTMFVGSAFLYAGIKGYSITQAIQYIVSGKSPTTLGQKFPIQQSDVQPPLGSGTSSTVAPVSNAPSSTFPAVSGGTYTMPALIKLWTANGGAAGTAQNAACHAMQESTGRSWVTSDNPDGGTNVGLWQLDTKGVGSGHTIAELQNPDTNARLTILATGNGRNWSQWATPGC
jgi:hypothetical protein